MFVQVKLQQYGVIENNQSDRLLVGGAEGAEVGGVVSEDIEEGGSHNITGNM